MISIPVEPLTHASFAPFGQFYSITNPEGYSLNGNLHRFFPDRLTASTGHNVGYSTVMVKKPDRMIIDAVEYHLKTWEMMMPLNDNMIFHVAPASAGTPVPELTRAFLVPKGTLIKINATVWHLCPLPETAPELIALVILPECTYANDCTVVSLTEEQYFEIIR